MILGVSWRFLSACLFLGSTNNIGLSLFILIEEARYRAVTMDGISQIWVEKTRVSVVVFFVEREIVLTCGLSRMEFLLSLNFIRMKSRHIWEIFLPCLFGSY